MFATDKGHRALQDGRPMPGVCHCAIGQDHSVELYDNGPIEPGYPTDISRNGKCKCEGFSCIGCASIPCLEEVTQDDNLCNVCRDYGRLISGDRVGTIYARYAHCHLARSADNA